MRRRDFITLVGASVAATLPRVALAQQPTKVPRVALFDVPRAKSQTDAFFQGLADRGYTDGKNIIVEFFTAPTIADQPAVAAKAVASAPTVIVVSDETVVAATQATKTIPIVFRMTQDPVKFGVISNLAHPAGNVTGAAGAGSIVAAKVFGFLREMVPDLSRVAFFGRSAEGIFNAVQRSDVLAAGAATGIDIVVIDINDTRDFRPYFAQALTAGAQAVYPGAYGYSTTPMPLDVLNALSAGQKQQPTYNSAYLTANNNMITNAVITSYLALLNGLPAVSGAIGTAGIATGNLLAYAEPNSRQFRRAAYFVDDILRGAKPGDLPVELPTVYDLTINLKTAKGLGLVVPQSILLTATQVFE